MKLTHKQKEYQRIHGYTIINHNGLACILKPDSTCVPATPEQFGLFAVFTPKTFWGEIKEDFKNLIEIIRLKHELLRRWQMQVLCDAKSKLHRGQRFWVLQDFNGGYHVINRDGVKIAKSKGWMNKHATFLDLDKEAIYISKQK